MDISGFVSAQPVRASVFHALHRQHGSDVTDNQHPATERRAGRIHWVALAATFVTPVTSCRRHLIHGVGCGCQRTSVMSQSNVQVCLFLQHPSTPPPTHTPPLIIPVSTLSAPLLIVAVWLWKTVRAAKNTAWWLANSGSVEKKHFNFPPPKEPYILIFYSESARIRVHKVLISILAECQNVPKWKIWFTFIDFLCFTSSVVLWITKLVSPPLWTSEIYQHLFDGLLWNFIYFTHSLSGFIFHYYLMTDDLETPEGQSFYLSNKISQIIQDRLDFFYRLCILMTLGSSWLFRCKFLISSLLWNPSSAVLCANLQMLTC